MDPVVHVVYRYSDYRKENDPTIIAVCKTHATALEKLYKLLTTMLMK